MTKKKLLADLTKQPATPLKGKREEKTPIKEKKKQSKSPDKKVAPKRNGSVWVKSIYKHL